LNVTTNFQTFGINSSFTGLTSVDFSSSSLTLDNIQVDAGAAVPEPPTFVMLGGIAAVLALRRKLLRQ
jgi:hypothetical protein